MIEKSSALSDGIKAVGIGQRGSKSLSPELVDAILGELKEGNQPPAAIGAFFAGLFLKGVSSDEVMLEKAYFPGFLSSAEKLAREVCADAPDFVQKFCIRILSEETLSVSDATRLGKFLFSREPGDSARGLIASALRVRYETLDEYEGILSAMQETLEPAFTETVPKGLPVIQISEPFTGVNSAFFITPLLANTFAEKYRVLSLCGRNPGPKMGMNLLDTAKKMGADFARSNREISGKTPKFGWYIRQKDLSQQIDRWVEIRRQIIKRPFISVLEKLLNPAQADILIASSFHPPYAAKVAETANRAGFLGSIVVANGQEGIISFPVNRPAKLLCSARQRNGGYCQEEMVIKPIISTGENSRISPPTAEKNAQLICSYIQNGTSGDAFFDACAINTGNGIQKAVKWIENVMQTP